MFDNLNTQKLGGKPATRSVKLLETDTYIATVYGVVGLGTVTDEYQGEVKESLKVRFLLEFPDETDDEGNVAVQKLDLPVSGHEKSNMYRLLRALNRTQTTQDFAAVGLGEGIEKSIGKSFRVQVVKKTSKTSGREYNRAVPGTITALSKKEDDRVLVNEPILFDLSNPDIDVFKKLTKYTIKDILNSPEGSNLGTEYHEFCESLFEEKKDEGEVLA